MNNDLFIAVGKTTISKLYIATITRIYSSEDIDEPDGILIGVMNGEEIALYGDEAENFLEKLRPIKAHKEVSLPNIK